MSTAPSGDAATSVGRGTPPATPSATPPAAAPAVPPARSGRPLTIGQVSKLLVAEFPEISISKIRYLEDRKLIEPRRTSGGYRLFSADDVERLRTILRLQRDEFLPLRVIRQELAAGRGQEAGGRVVEADAEGDGEPEADAGSTVPGGHRPRIRGGGGRRHTLEEVCEATRAAPDLVKELRDFGIVQGTTREGVIVFDDDEREIVRAAVELARYGVGGRHLRVLRSSADREGALLEQLLGPALRSRSAERRTEAIDALETLSATTTRLTHLLLVRDLRRLVA